MLKCCPLLAVALLFGAGADNHSTGALASDGGAERNAHVEIRELLGPDGELSKIVERGIQATIAQKMHAAYDGLDALSLRVTVRQTINLLPADEIPETVGLSMQTLEQSAAKLKHEFTVDWRMTNTGAVSVTLFRGARSLLGSPRPPDPEKPPFWEWVARWETGPPAGAAPIANSARPGAYYAVERRGSKSTPPYALESWPVDRAPRLIGQLEFSCGLIVMFPYSIVGRGAKDNSPRAFWGDVIVRGRYDGIFSAESGARCVRVTSETTLADGSLDRVRRVYLDPKTWRFVQIEEFGPGIVGDKPAAIICRRGESEEVPTEPPPPEAFDFDRLAPAEAKATSGDVGG